jgi:PBP1b-binding outer membrane lipoprotein LpoB
MKKSSTYLLLALVLLGSCYTSNKANKQLNKANDKYPTEVAKFTRQHFPCITTDSIQSTDTLYKYLSVICPPDTSQTDTIYLDKIRAVVTPITRTRVIAIPSKTITITKSVEDSAQVKIITADRDRISQALETYRTRMEKKSEWIKWLLIALIVSLLGNFILLYIRKP